MAREQPDAELAVVTSPPNILVETVWLVLPLWLRKAMAAGRRCRNWYVAQWVATPPWVDHSKVARIYAEARRRRLVVDHIVPLQHPLVCGLHVEHNLRVMEPGANAMKGNRYWPGCPWENEELFDLEPEPHQMALL